MKRKIKSIYHKVVIMLLLSIVVTNQFTFAIGNVSHIKNDEEVILGKYRIYARESSEQYIRYQGRLQRNIEYFYIDEQGNEMPAYCLNLGVDGAETMEEYYVNVNEAIQDPKLKSIILKGYPYQSVEQLQLQNKTEAQYATQFAVWAYLANLNVEEIVATEPMYERIVLAIRTIYYNGVHGWYDENNCIEIQNEEFVVDDLSEQYLSAKIHLAYNENVKNIRLNVSGIEEYQIMDMNNQIITDMNQIQDFKILVPRDKLFEDKNIHLRVEYDTIQTAIMFGSAEIDGMQNVGITLKPIVTKTAEKTLPLLYRPIIFEIMKVDKDHPKTGIPNVTFHIYNMKNELLGKYVTDEQGKIRFDILRDLKVGYKEMIKVKEVSVPEGYYIDQDNDLKHVQVNFDRPSKIVFENERIKGKIKIVKTSYDFNPHCLTDKDTPLKDAIFEIYDHKGNLVEEISTNENGEAITKNLYKGNYYVKEKKAPEYYILDESTYQVEIKKHGEIVELEIKNKSKPKPLPKTGY